MAKKAVVVGVDGTEESRRALEVAAHLAAAARSELVPVYAVPDLWLAGGVEQVPAIQPEVYEILIQDARDQMQRFVADVLGGAARAELDLRTGLPAAAIADAAREHRAELVVLGGKHHGAIARGLGRSTAHYLVRTLDVPVLIVGPGAVSLTHVLAAVDVSKASVPALRAAQRFATLLHAKLRVMHAVEPLGLMYLPVSAGDQLGFEERSRAAFERLLRPFPEIGPEDRVVRTGLAPETIIAEATAWPAQLVVVGSHGKNWFDRVLVGSTTERLLNALATSLLVVPTVEAAARPRRRVRRRGRPRPRLKAARKRERRPRPKRKSPAR